MTVKVGLIGCGHIARFHARNIRDAIKHLNATQTDEVEYSAVCDRTIKRAAEFALIAGCKLVTDNAQQVIDACDAVYICTHTSEHIALVAAAAEAGCAVFCEKPLATTLADAQQMHKLIEQAGVVNQVGLVLNFSPVYTVLADLMRGDWGVLLCAHMRDDQFFPISGQYGSDWRGDRSKAGGGTLLEHSIHDVDLFRRLFGEVEAVQCSTREISGRPGIEDIAQVSFHHIGGHTTTLASVWHDIDSRPSGRSLEVFFERARFTTEQDYFGSITYEVDNDEPVTLSSDEVLARFMQLSELNPAQEDLRSLGGLGDRRFLQSVLANTPATPDFADALRSHVIVDACYRSARESSASVAIS